MSGQRKGDEIAARMGSWFGRGTSQGGGCSSYETYCGYCGTETGSTNNTTCPTSISDGVANTGTPYFAAFPIGRFRQGTTCGMCVDVTWMGKTITATIVDECATCTTAGGGSVGVQFPMTCQ